RRPRQTREPSRKNSALNSTGQTKKPAGMSSPGRLYRMTRAGSRLRRHLVSVECFPINFKRYFSEVATFPIISPDITADSAEYLVASGLACIGTPEDCVRHFERLWQGSNGGFGGVLLLAHNWADWAATKRSYELMARHVHPHFQRNANALRDWSYADAKSKYETAGAQSQAAVQAAIGKHQRRQA